MNKNFWTLVLMGLWLFLAGCEEKEIPIVSDEDQIRNFISNSLDGQELFRINDISLDHEYSVPFDTARYIDITVSKTRTITVDIRGPVQIESLGQFKDALATVVDDFAMQTLRIEGVDTTMIPSGRRFTRIGYFVKLGSDAKPYLGWKLYGFNGIGNASVPVSVDIRSKVGSLFFPGDLSGLTSTMASFGFSHLKLSDFTKVDQGAQMVVQTSKSPNDKLFHFFGIDKDGGFDFKTMDTTSEGEATIDFVTRTSGNKFFDLLFFQSFEADSAAAKLEHIWCVPFQTQF